MKRPPWCCGWHAVLLHGTPDARSTCEPKNDARFQGSRRMWRMHTLKEVRKQAAPPFPCCFSLKISSKEDFWGNVGDGRLPCPADLSSGIPAALAHGQRYRGIACVKVWMRQARGLAVSILSR